LGWYNIHHGHERFGATVNSVSRNIAAYLMDENRGQNAYVYSN